MPPRRDGGRTSEEDRALGPRQHQPRGFAAGEETAIARHLPHLAEHALGGFEQREIHVGARIEDADFQRRVRVGLIEEGGDVFFLARIQPARDACAAFRFDLGFQLGEFLGGAASREDRVAFARKALGDGGTDEIARADHGTGGIALGHIASFRALLPQSIAGREQTPYPKAERRNQPKCERKPHPGRPFVEADHRVAKAVDEVEERIGIGEPAQLGRQHVDGVEHPAHHRQRRDEEHVEHVELLEILAPTAR